MFVGWGWFDVYELVLFGSGVFFFGLGFWGFLSVELLVWLVVCKVVCFCWGFVDLGGWFGEFGFKLRVFEFFRVEMGCLLGVVNGVVLFCVVWELLFVGVFFLVRCFVVGLIVVVIGVGWVGVGMFGIMCWIFKGVGLVLVLVMLVMFFWFNLLEEVFWVMCFKIDLGWRVFFFWIFFWFIVGGIGFGLFMGVWIIICCFWDLGLFDGLERGVVDVLFSSVLGFFFVWDLGFFSKVVLLFMLVVFIFICGCFWWEMVVCFDEFCDWECFDEGFVLSVFSFCESVSWVSVCKM